jgi:putative ABC transport system permease protein
MLRELRYGLRSLKSNPFFAVVAIVTLALGIGANTAMFSVVNGVLLRPLDYPNASRIVQLKTSFIKEKRSIPRVTGPDWIDIRSSASLFDQVTYYYGGEMGVQLADHAEFVGTYLVAPDWFSVFGVTAAYGRTFVDSDAGQSAAVSLLFAQRNFGSASAALGRTIHVEGRAYQIVGVTPGNFHFPQGADVWLALTPSPQGVWRERTAYNYRALALLRPGAGLESANAQMETVGARLQAAYPDSNQDKTFLALSLQSELVGTARTTLYFLMGAVSLVLLIACANVANLLLARATARQREMAVRAALGATRTAIMRQLLIESAVLGLAGGTWGLFLAFVGTRILTRATAEQMGLPRVAEIQMNWTVLAFAIGVSAVASLLFGVSPAVQAAKVNLSDQLKQGGRGLAGSSNLLRGALVVAQVALSFALAIGAGLLFRSFLALNTADLGYRTQGLLVMYAHDPARTLEQYLEAGQTLATAVDEMKRIPGVISAAAAMGVPTGEYGSNGNYVIDGQDFRDHRNDAAHADFSLAGPGYFATMGISLERGRDFSPADGYDRQFVVIISESVARQSFPGKDPIGHEIQCGLDDPKWMTVIGVVADVRQDSPASSPGPTLYMPLLQHPYHANEVELVMRSAVSPTSLIDPVRAKMLSLHPEIATKFTTMEAMVADSIATPRLQMVLAGLFAGLALVLAMAGMYGVMSYLTTQRIPEFGLRMALGSSPGRVLTQVLGRAAQLTILGVAVGLGLAFSAARVMNSMLYGLTATDVGTYAAVLLAMTPIVVLAAAIPAWRAAHVDPAIALRNE